MNSKLTAYLKKTKSGDKKQAPICMIEQNITFQDNILFWLQASGDTAWNYAICIISILENYEY